MTNKQLFDSLNDADDKYIIEAVEDFPELGVEKKRGFIRVLKYALPCAACAAVIFAFTSVIGNNVGVFTPLFSGETSAEVSDSVSDGDVESSSAEISAETPNSTEDSTVIDIESQPGELTNTYSKFLEEEKKFSETFVSPGIVYGEPLPLPEKDPATFWEGDLPVMPLKNCTNSRHESTGKEFSLHLDVSGSYQASIDAVRGEAVYAVTDGEVTFIGVPGLPISSNLTVVINHYDKVYTTYSSLDEDLGIPVKVGDKVKAGQVIGYAGVGITCESPTNSMISYGAFAYDPFDYLYQKNEYSEAWLNSGLVYPLDNVGDDFEFDYAIHDVSRNEKIIPAPYGANVYAVSGGRIVYDMVGLNGELVIKIEHENDIETVYYHLDNNFPHVKWGDVVEAGDVIGHVSNSSYNGVSGLGYYVYDQSYIHTKPTMSFDQSE